jgi:DinB family protein
MHTDLAPEQTRALAYLRHAGTEAPVANIRRKVAETFRDLDALVETIPEDLVRVRPGPGRWCVQEVVDHLVVSHRWAGNELAALLAGEAPQDGPIPASLQSPGVMDLDWPALRREMSEVHGRLASLAAEAADETSLAVRAPVIMVVKVQGEDGEVRPVPWREELDWKAYVMAFRAHALEHAAQIRRTLDAIRA